MSRPGVLRAAAFAVPALAAPLLVVLSTRRDGLNLSPDSVAYLAAADGLADGAGVVGLDGGPLSLYAPGLPWVLALPAAHGVAVGAAYVLNLLTLAALVLGLGYWLDRFVRRSVAVAAAGAATVTAPLLSVHAWLWSEPLYILVTAGFLAVLVRLRTAGPRPTRWVVGAGLLAATATLVRYGGVSVLPIAAVVLLSLPVPWRERVRTAAVFAVAYAVPVGAWLARNAWLTDELAGERVSSATSSAVVLEDGVRTLARWLTPESLPPAGRLWACGLLAAGVVVLGVAARRDRSAGPRGVVLAVLAGHVATAFLVLFVLTARANVNDLGPRLLSPLLVPLVALLAVAADLVLDRVPRPGRALCAALMVVAVGWCALPATVRQVSAAGAEAASFTRGRWQAEETQVLVAAVPAGSSVVSNSPWGVYYLTGRAVGESPRVRYHASELAPPGDADELVAAVRAGPTYLVWFARSDPGYHDTPEHLAGRFGLTAVERSPAGVVYRVTAARR